MFKVDAGADAVIIGGGASETFLGESHELQVNDTNFSVASFATYRNGQDGPFLSLGHSRNGTINSHTVLNDDDTMGLIMFYGSDGTDFARGASIQASVDGTPGNNDMPGRLVFSTTADGSDSPTERLRILSSGELVTGGLSSASGHLHLYADASYSGSIVLQSQVTANASAEITMMSRDSSNVNHNTTITNTAGTLVINEAGGDADFKVESTGFANQLYVDAGNNTVGIGRIASSMVLDVESASSGTLNAFRIRNSGTAAGAEVKQHFSLNRTGSAVDFECASIVVGKEQEWTGTASTVDGFMAFHTIQNETTAEKLRLTSGGKVLIGHTAAVATHAEKLGIDCDQASGFGIFVSGDASTGGSTNVTAMRFYDSGSSAGVVGSIVFNTSSTAFNTSSDYRLKENVTDLTNATARLKQLEPKRFNFKGNSDKTVDGFLAHEVSSIVPEAITGEKDAVDDEGEPVYQGIDQSKLVPLLVATIKELEARIAALESE